MNWNSVRNMDRRVIYLLLLLVLSFPLFRPVGIPLVTSALSKKSFDYIEKLPPGSVVAFATDTGVASQGEQMPQASVLFRQITRRKDLKIVLITFWEQGTIYLNALMEEAGHLKDREYGKDWVDLGFIPGGEAAMAAVADDIHRAIPTDARGNKTSDLQLMKSVKTAKDINLLITISAGTPGVPEYARQWQSRHGTPIIAGVLSQFATIYMPYVDSKQLVGLLGGLRSAAEFEQLLGIAGTAGRSMDALSLAHIMVVIFVCLANISYFALKREQKGV